MLTDCATDGSYLAVFPLESWQGDISNIDDILVLFALVGSTEQFTDNWL